MTNLATAPYRVHRMIQDLMRNPAEAASFANDPAADYRRYGLTEREAALLETGTLEAMTELGVHPNLQMKYLRLRKAAGDGAKLIGTGPLDAYLDRLLER